MDGRRARFAHCIPIPAFDSRLPVAYVDGLQYHQVRADHRLVLIKRRSAGLEHLKSLTRVLL
jgi:hypothetical protein